MQILQSCAVDHFNMTVQRNGHDVHVQLNGHFLLGGATQQFREVVESLSEMNLRLVSIGLKGISKLDSAGLGELGRVAGSQLAGHRLLLKDYNERCIGLLQLTKLITLYDLPAATSNSQTSSHGGSSTKTDRVHRFETVNFVNDDDSWFEQ